MHDLAFCCWLCCVLLSLTICFANMAFAYLRQLFCLFHVFCFSFHWTMYRWISVGSDLKFDARRDLHNIGATCVEGRIFALLVHQDSQSTST